MTAARPAGPAPAPGAPGPRPPPRPGGVGRLVPAEDAAAPGRRKSSPARPFPAGPREVSAGLPGRPERRTEGQGARGGVNPLPPELTRSRRTAEREESLEDRSGFGGVPAIRRWFGEGCILLNVNLGFFPLWTVQTPHPPFPGINGLGNLKF